MRELVDRARLNSLMAAFGRVAGGDVAVYFVGGVTAVLMGWRSSTIDVDLTMQPEDDELLRAVPALKERLQVNIELVSPADFVPVPAGWEERSVPIERLGRVHFYHYDLYAQALAKVERGHAQDVDDVRQMVARGLVEPTKALDYFARIEPMLYRYPAVDAPSFRRAVEETFRTEP